MNGGPEPSRDPRDPPGPGPETRPGWVESLPFFLAGGAAVVIAVILLAIHSDAALAHLPVWAYLLAGGSIALVGGTVGSFAGEPIPDLPEENELVGTDLIVVSRARWKELNKMERWVEDRLVPAPPTDPVRPARSTPAPGQPASAARAKRSEAFDQGVPTLDELLAGLPPVPESEVVDDELWSETEESRETPQRELPAVPRIPPRSAAPVSPPPPFREMVTAPAPSRPAPRAVRPSPASARSEVEPPADLEQLLSDLQTEAEKAVEAKEIETALPDTGALACAGCGRAVDVTERWDHCDECLGAYCANCDSQLLLVGARKLCPTCRAGRRRARR
jgi:hypothetical protein